MRVERAIDLAHHRDGAFRAGGADDDAVGPLEVADRRAFAQEFGVRHDLDVEVGLQFPRDSLDLVASAHGHGRLGDDDRRTIERSDDFPRCSIDIGEIGMAVAAPRRRADRDEDCVRALDACGQIGGEGQATRSGIVADQLVQPRLEDRHLPRFDRRDLARILIDTDHIMAKIRKTGP